MREVWAGVKEKSLSSEGAPLLLQSVQSLVVTAAKACRTLAAQHAAHAAAGLLEVAVNLACKLLPRLPGLAEQKAQNLTQHLRRV